MTRAPSLSSQFFVLGNHTAYKRLINDVIYAVMTRFTPDIEATVMVADCVDSGSRMRRKCARDTAKNIIKSLLCGVPK